MDYISYVLETLGKAIADKDYEIQSLKWRNETLEHKIEELEEQIKTKITVTTTVNVEKEE